MDEPDSETHRLIQLHQIIMDPGVTVTAENTKPENTT